MLVFRHNTPEFMEGIVILTMKMADSSELRKKSFGKDRFFMTR